MTIRVTGPDDDGLLWIRADAGGLHGAVSVRAASIAGRAFAAADALPASPSPGGDCCPEPGCILGRHDDPDSSHWNGKRGWSSPGERERGAVADALERKAREADIGATFVGGPLHGTSVFNFYSHAARAVRDLAPAPARPEGTKALEKCMAVLRWHLSAFQRKDEPMMLAALEAGETALGRRERLVPPVPLTGGARSEGTEDARCGVETVTGVCDMPAGHEGEHDDRPLYPAPSAPQTTPAHVPPRRATRAHWSEGEWTCRYADTQCPYPSPDCAWCGHLEIRLSAEGAAAPGKEK